MDRRELLKGVFFSGAAAVVPIKINAAEVAIPTPAGPMWAVGSEGEGDWQPVSADTAEEAIASFCEINDLFNQAGSPSASVAELREEENPDETDADSKSSNLVKFVGTEAKE